MNFEDIKNGDWEKLEEKDRLNITNFLEAKKIIDHYSAKEIWEKLTFMQKAEVILTIQSISKNDGRTKDEKICDYVKSMNRNEYPEARTEYEKYLKGIACWIYMCLFEKYSEPAPSNSKYWRILDEKYIDLHFTVKKQKDETEKQNNKY